MNSEMINNYVNWLYEVYPKCSAGTLLDDLVNLSTCDKLSELLGIPVTEELQQRIVSQMRKYDGVKLYCYCCGELFPLPKYHGDAFVRFVEDTLSPVNDLLEKE